MGSNVVIVALPEENDPVWEISSEKVPHLTLLFLGEDVANLEQIVLFVEHAASTMLKQFHLTVDHRGTLGEDQADVAFFRQHGHGTKVIRDFRAALLQDANIKTAYDSSPQFDGGWLPHLTLGYPAAPAKTDDPGLYGVGFNRIAVWVDEFDGPEFRLKDYWEEFDQVEDPMDVAMSELNHYGQKGMKWGVRKTEAGWERDSTGIKIRGKTIGTPKARRDISFKANKATVKGLSWLDKQPEFVKARKNGDLKNPKSEAYQKYDKAGFDIWSSEMKKATENYKRRVSPSGTRELDLQIVENKSNREASTWTIGIKERKVQHADEDADVYTVRVIRDAEGTIIDIVLVEDTMTQATELGEEFLEHFGTKGMKWGVRKDQIGSVAKSVSKAAVTVGKAVGDTAFEANIQTETGQRQAMVDIDTKARQAFKRTDLPALKERHGDYGKMRNRAKKPFSKEARSYRKDARETYIKRLEDAANSMSNTSGTRQYTIRERGWELPASGGALPKSKHFWEVTSREIQHADGDFTWDIEVIEDGEGYISDLQPIETRDSVAQALDLGTEFVLAHFGIKGMKWGQRKAPPTAVATTAVSRVPHGTKRKTKIKVEGGENHPASDDAIKVAQARVKLKKSGAAALSNQELRDVANRVQLENQVSMLTSSRGKKFISREFQSESEKLAKQGFKSGASKAAPHAIKKAKKAAATVAVSALL